MALLGPFGALLDAFSFAWFEGVERMDETIEMDAFRLGVDEDARRRERPGPGPWMPPPDELRRRCERLEEPGINVEGLCGDRLRRLCEDLDR